MYLRYAPRFCAPCVPLTGHITCDVVIYRCRLGMFPDRLPHVAAPDRCQDSLEHCHMFAINSAVQASLNTLADKAAAVHTSAERGWKPILAEFRAIIADLGVVDRKSDGGKAIDAILAPRVLAALVKGADYDVEVHRVGSGDEYLPVDDAHPANFTIKGAYAVAVNLTELPSVKDSPRGMKAWLRGNAENGLRPDGGKGLRDLINNSRDQVLSRFWKKGKRAGGDGPTPLDRKLLDLYSTLQGARNRWETDGGECVTDAELKGLCDRFADSVLKRAPKGRKS